MKTRITLISFACLVLLSVSLAAQMTPPAPPTSPTPSTPAQNAQQILNLTDAQVQQLKDLRTAFVTNTQTLRANLRALQQQIATLLQSSSPDPAQLGKLVLQRETLQQQLTDAAKTYHTNALNVLTQAQKDQVAQIQAALKLAADAPPLAALGLLQGPGPGGLGTLGGGRSFGPMGRMGRRGFRGGAPQAPPQQSL